MNDFVSGFGHEPSVERGGLLKRAAFTSLAAAAALGLAACDDTQPPTDPLEGPEATASAARFADAFVTPEGAQARLVAGVSGHMKPLATVGDLLPGSEEPMLPIPDGIGVYGGQRFLTLMLNHELSDRGVEGKFQYSRVGKFTIDTKTLQILDHEYVVDGSEGFNRLCSAEWVDAEDGFAGGYFFTGEETDDGRQFAIDRQGRVTELVGLGRYAHENQISVPGFLGHVVVLNFDDNGGSGVGRDGAISELYMYVARNSNEVLGNRGDLYVFAVEDRDLLPNDLGEGDQITGHWVKIPRDVAADYAALEDYVDRPDVNAFPFIRLEDGFYDKRPGASPAAYFYDTGRSSITDPDTGDPVDPWGSIYRLDFGDPADPAGSTATLTLAARSTGPDAMWASPDNGDMNAYGIVMLQEDRANGPWLRRPGIWSFQLASDGSLVDPSGDKVVELVDPFQPDNAEAVFGNESSGIVDVSEWFGPGAWIFDVQAHDTPAPALGLSEENGQLLFMKLD